MIFRVNMTTVVISLRFVFQRLLKCMKMRQKMKINVFILASEL